MKVKNPQAAAERTGRATKRRLQHEVDEESQVKMLDIVEPGKTVRYNFAGTVPAEPQNLELFVSETEAGEGEDDTSDLQADLSGHAQEMKIAHLKNHGLMMRTKVLLLENNVSM